MGGGVVGLLNYINSKAMGKEPELGPGQNLYLSPSFKVITQIVGAFAKCQPLKFQSQIKNLVPALSDVPGAGRKAARQSLKRLKFRSRQSSPAI